MSWRVNGTGREYHDRDEYLRALRAAEDARRRAEEERTRRELNRLDNRRRELEAQFDGASNDSRRSEKILLQLQQNYQDMESFKNRVHQRQMEVERRMMEQMKEDQKHMERQIDLARQRMEVKTREMETAVGASRENLSREIKDARDALELLEQQRAALVGDIEKHMAETTKQFEELDNLINEKLNDLSNKLGDMNRKINAEKENLRAAMEDEFNRELAQIKNESDKADAIMKKVKEDLDTLASQVETYGLQSYSSAVIEKLNTALNEENSLNRLVLAQETQIEINTMKRLKEERENKVEAILEENIKDLDATIALLPSVDSREKLAKLKENEVEFNKLRLKGKLDPDLLPLLYYPDELDKAKADLETLKTDLLSEQQKPLWFNFEGRMEKRRKQLFALRDALTQYVDTAPSLETKHRNLRIPALKKVRQRMVRIIGAKPDFEALVEPKNAGSEKDFKVLHMEWGVRKYDAYIDIEGRVVDEMGYGYDSDKQCAGYAEKLRKEIAEQPRVGGISVDHANSPTSAPEVIEEVEKIKEQFKARNRNA